MENSGYLPIVLEPPSHPHGPLALLHHAIKEEDQLDSNSREGLNKISQSSKVLSPLAAANPRFGSVPVPEATHGVHHDSRRASGMLDSVLLGQLLEVDRRTYVWAGTSHKPL